MGGKVKVGAGWRQFYLGGVTLALNKLSANQLVQFIPPAFIKPFVQNLKAELMFVEAFAEFLP